VSVSALWAFAPVHSPTLHITAKSSLQNIEQAMFAFIVCQAWEFLVKENT